MPKVLVTGTPGSGKSTITRAIAERGFRAYDLDDFPDLIRLEVKGTGEPAKWPEGEVDWNYYAWNIQRKPFLRMLDGQEDLYIGVSATNLAEFYLYFDKIFALVVDDGLLSRRLRERDAHEFGQTEADIRRFIAINHDRTSQYIAAGAIPVNNVQSVEKVADFIIAKTQKL